MAVCKNLWNLKDLECPSVCSYKLKSCDVDIVTLRSLLLEAVNKFKDVKQLHQEAAILSRCVYRMKMKFRAEKGLRAMEKTNHALLNYLRMDVPKIIESFCGMVPQKFTLNTYLPSRNMLQYLLVRMQGVSKLLIRITSEAKNIAQYMQQRVSIGQFWNIAFIIFGVASRIFALAKNLANFCCKFYNRLYPFANMLQIVGANWLPDDYCLPSDLKAWLDVDWLDKTDQLESRVKAPFVFNIGIIVESDSDVEVSGQYTEINDDVEIVNEYMTIKGEYDIRKKNQQNQNNLHRFIENEDVGKTVGREELLDLRELKTKNEAEAIPKDTSKKRKKKKHKLKQQPSNSSESKLVKLENATEKINSDKAKAKSKKKKNRQVVHNLITNIKVLKDLKVFERDFDKIYSKYSSSFQNMDKMQCNMLHNVIKKCIKKAKKNAADTVKVNLLISEAKQALSSNLK